MQRRAGERGTTPDRADSAGGVLRSQSVRAATEDGYVSWDGAILRIDPETGEAAADNPLVDNGIDNDDRIVAYGLRNPYRFSFRPDTDQLYIGDIGAGTVEELNRFRTGSVQSEVPNFGWPCYEGAERQGQYSGLGLGLCDDLYASNAQDLGGVGSALTAPFYGWRHSDAYLEGCRATGASSANGGTFVTDEDWPEHLQGALVFADMGRGCVIAMQLGADGEPDPSTVEVLVSGVRATAIHSGPDGDLYFTDSANNSLVGSRRHRRLRRWRSR